MKTQRVAVIGASGFSGIELLRLVARHPEIELAFATSDRWVGQSVSTRLGLGLALPGAFVSVDDGLTKLGQTDLVFLATPAEVSLELVPKLRAAGTRVVDLSGAFRLKDLAEYPRVYKFAHTHPALVSEAVYGIPELFRDRVRGQRLVANPGCYPTAAALSVAPLLRAGLIDPESVVINAASGVSGAGRKASEDYSFMEISGDFRAYKVLAHQHQPEIAQTLAAVAGEAVSLVFTPHLLPIQRGILSTAVARLKPNVSRSAVSDAFAAAYSNEPLVTVLPTPEGVRIADVANTPHCRLGVATDGAHVVSIAAIDNLLKGAASQAMQNLNLMLGLPELSGLV
jgi:N-acetyl-gamma-glutamyl-phosphate reductase